MQRVTMTIDEQQFATLDAFRVSLARRYALF